MIDRLIEPRKPKLNVSLDDYDLIQDDYSHYKSISDYEDGNIGNWNDFDKSNVKIANETNIYDPFDLHLPENVEKYKYATINEDEIDELFLGFVDKEPIKHKQLDNVYKFGNPSPEQFRLSNWQTEQGTSNRLNQQIMSIETNENIEDIIETQIKGDKAQDVVFEKEVDDIMTKLDKDYKYIDEQIKENNKYRPITREAHKNNEELKNMKNLLKENSKSDIDDVREHRDTMKKVWKEKAKIKQVIDEAFPNRKKKENVIKKEEPKEEFKEFKEENPMNDEEEKRKKDIERKKVYAKRQEEMNDLVNPIKKENENLKKFTELKEKIQNLDISKLETKDPLRKEVNVLLKQYNKNIGKSQLKGTVLKTLNQIEPQIKLISEKRIEEAEMRNKSIESEKKEPRKPRKSTVHKLSTMEYEPRQSLIHKIGYDNYMKPNKEE